MRKVIRLPFGHGMHQLDPATGRRVRKSLPEQVRDVIALAEDGHASKILELEPLEIGDVAIAVASKTLRVDVGSRTLEEFDGVEIARLIADEGSNLTKLVLIRTAWNGGVAGEDDLVDAVMGAFREHGSEIPSRYTESPKEFEEDVRYAVRNWLRKASKVSESARTLSMKDAQWIWAITEEVHRKRGKKARRNLQLERYLAQVLIWARAHGRRTDGGLEFDLPWKIEVAWKVASHDRLAALRAPIFETADAREALHRAAEEKRSVGGRAIAKRQPPKEPRRRRAPPSNIAVAVLREVRRPHHSDDQPGVSSVRRVLLRYEPGGALLYSNIEGALVDILSWPELRRAYTRSALGDLRVAKGEIEQTSSQGGEKETLSIDPRSDPSNATDTFWKRCLVDQEDLPRSLVGLRTVDLPEPPEAPPPRKLTITDLHPEMTEKRFEAERARLKRDCERRRGESVATWQDRRRIAKAELASLKASERTVAAVTKIYRWGRQPLVAVSENVIVRIANSRFDDDFKRGLLELAMYAKANMLSAGEAEVVRLKTGIEGPFIELGREDAERFHKVGRNKAAAFIRLCRLAGLDGKAPILVLALDYSTGIRVGGSRQKRGRIFRFDPALLDAGEPLSGVAAARRRLDDLLQARSRVRARRLR